MLHSLDLNVGEVGATVQKGSGWHDAGDQEIELCACGPGDQHVVRGHASVLSTWTGALSGVPAKLVEHAHGSLRYTGLLARMRKMHGEDFDERETVTVLSYKRLD
jgi:hypothetical protein